MYSFRTWSDPGAFEFFNFRMHFEISSVVNDVFRMLLLSSGLILVMIPSKVSSSWLFLSELSYLKKNQINFQSMVFLIVYVCLLYSATSSIPSVIFFFIFLNFYLAYSIAMVRRPSAVRTSSIHHFQKYSSPKPLGQSKPNFIWSLNGIGERKFVREVWITWPRWPPSPYMIKTL